MLVRKLTRLSEELARWLEAEAKKSGVSESAFIAIVLQEKRKKGE